MTLGQSLVDGAWCPCCDQWAKIYRWKLYGSAIRLLHGLYEWASANGSEFVHSRDVKRPGQGGDGTQLRHWGLVEQEKERRPDGGRSGFWRITVKGVAFLKDQTKIPKYAYVYNGEVLSLSGDLVSVRDIIGNTFNYDEMMGPAD